MRTLDQLMVGQTATVLAVRPDTAASGMLSALGLLPGIRVRVERCAPLGDPISLVFGGQTISVRRKDAEAVQIG
jgi:ferrous iron transport protein A